MLSNWIMKSVSQYIWDNMFGEYSSRAAGGGDSNISFSCLSSLIELLSPHIFPLPPPPSKEAAKEEREKRENPFTWTTLSSSWLEEEEEEEKYLSIFFFFSFFPFH